MDLRRLRWLRLLRNQRWTVASWESSSHLEVNYLGKDIHSICMMRHDLRKIERLSQLSLSLHWMLVSCSRLRSLQQPRLKSMVLTGKAERSAAGILITHRPSDPVRVPRSLARYGTLSTPKGPLVSYPFRPPSSQTYFT